MFCQSCWSGWQDAKPTCTVSFSAFGSRIYLMHLCVVYVWICSVLLFMWNSKNGRVRKRCEQQKPNKIVLKNSSNKPSGQSQCKSNAYQCGIAHNNIFS